MVPKKLNYIAVGLRIYFKYKLFVGVLYFGIALCLSLEIGLKLLN
jgi:hypothetical protein